MAKRGKTKARPPAAPASWTEYQRAAARRERAFKEAAEELVADRKRRAMLDALAERTRGAASRAQAMIEERKPAPIPHPVRSKAELVLAMNPPVTVR